MQVRKSGETYPLLNGKDELETMLKVTEQVRNDMERLFEPETQQAQVLIGKTKPQIRALASDKKDLDQFFHHKTSHEGTLMSPLLWRNDQRPQGNFHLAKSLFLRCEEFYRDPGFKQSIQKIVDKWVGAKYLRRLDWEVAISNREAFYLPSFVAIKIEWDEVKHRLVFNAAKKFGGKSLNCYLSSGPNLMNDLVEILMLFRQHPHTYSAENNGHPGR